MRPWTSASPLQHPLPGSRSFGRELGVNASGVIPWSTAGSSCPATVTGSRRPTTPPGPARDADLPERRFRVHPAFGDRPLCQLPTAASPLTLTDRHLPKETRSCPHPSKSSSASSPPLCARPAALPALAPCPDRRHLHTGPDGAARQALTVGFLPVTCHLTCPVTDYATHQSDTGTRFELAALHRLPDRRRRREGQAARGDVYDRPARHEAARTGRARQNLLSGPPRRLGDRRPQRRPGEEPARPEGQDVRHPQPVQQPESRAA